MYKCKHDVNASLVLRSVTDFVDAPDVLYLKRGSHEAVDAIRCLAFISSHYYLREAGAIIRAAVLMFLSCTCFYQLHVRGADVFTEACCLLSKNVTESTD